MNKSIEEFLAEEYLVEKVVKRTDGWYVVSRSGKNLGGPYNSEKRANKRLRQVEFFKHKND